MKNKRRQSTISESEILLWICVLIGILFLSAFTIICTFTNLPMTFSGLVLLTLYIVLAGVIYVSNRRKLARQKALKKDSSNLSTVMADMLQNVEIPFVITDEGGKIIWYNDRLSHLSESNRSLFGTNVADFCPLPFAEVLAKSGAIEDDSVPPAEDPEQILACIQERDYLLKSHRMSVAQKDYFMTVFTDVTDKHLLQKQLKDENTVVAFIILDNLEELTQFVKVSYRAATGEIENILKRWADDLDGILREYDHDKYMLLFPEEKLAACVENQFDILEPIRNVRIGDNSIPVTVSMGIAVNGATLAERERNASAALDMALQRGGDQVALRTDAGLEFYGGRTKSLQRRTKVRARVIAGQLLSLITNADNVLIMGHANPDFDSIGACIGVARLAMFCGVEAKIVMNKENTNFLACTEALRELDEYKNIFISGAAGLDMLRSKTLLVMVDVNAFPIVEAPEIAQNAFDYVIIDHHRKTAEFSKEPALSYIDPSASSACELVTEILEQCLPTDTLLNEEAHVMLSGIMVDTKNFTRSTGTRTFSAALYLRGEGGNSEVAREFFNTDFDDFVAEAKFGSSITIYRDRIAITTSDGTDAPDGDRIAASKMADKVLTIKHVDAAFALVNIKNTIHISARSNGSLNVQLILEQIGGGGHFDAAGAQITDASLKEVLILLKKAIDDYMDKQ